MDYEKKLKLAKEALNSGSYDKDTIEYIFPELKESEDERIRKNLMEWFEEFPDKIWRGHYKKDILAWLEKQGETNPYSGISFEYNGHIWGMCARDNGVDILLDKQLVNHLEMRNEQNQKVNYPKFEFKDVLALQCCIETVKKVIEYKNLYEQLQSLHSRLYDAYQLKKKYEQKLL